MTALALLLGASVAMFAASIPGDPGPQVKAPTTAVSRADCVTDECHPAVKLHAVVHGPLLVNACDSCHRLIDAETHAYEMTRAPDNMCTFCHEISIPRTSLVHKPVESMECLPCHDPHGGTGPSFLRGDRYADTCTKCHEDVTGGWAHLHGPAGAGACGACHAPHASRFPNLLDLEGTDLCLRCHVTIAAQLESAPLVHSPVKTDCQVCHDPHATDKTGLVSNDPVALCTGCHEAIGETLENSRNKHAAVTDESACLTCHDPHASDQPRLLRDKASRLCFECHDRKIERKKGKRIVNMKALIEGSRYVHGPAADDDCAACHQVHGSGFSRLLDSEYATRMYYPFTASQYALCFSCHDKELMEEAETSTVTGFRNGSTNLHYVHVHQAKKGRSCQICHDPHAGEGRHHMRREFPFGPSGWMLQIQWSKAPNGGGCVSGCHVDYDYDRIDPVVYPERPEDEDWKGVDLVPGTRSEPR